MHETTFAQKSHYKISQIITKTKTTIDLSTGANNIPILFLTEEVILDQASCPNEGADKRLLTGSTVCINTCDAKVTQNLSSINGRVDAML